MEGKKTCSKCKTPKEYSKYAPQATGRDGYRANCRECDRKRAKGYVKNDEQKARAKVVRKVWYSKNKEKVCNQVKERYYKTHNVTRRNIKRDFKSEEERRAHHNKQHTEWLRKNPDKARNLNKQMRQRHGEEINAKLSLARGLGIAYKDVKQFPELIELKKLQLAGLKEATVQLNPNNKNYKKNGS